MGYNGKSPSVCVPCHDGTITAYDRMAQTIILYQLVVKKTTIMNFIICTHSTIKVSAKGGSSAGEKMV
jgi:hypothetical protein